MTFATLLAAAVLALQGTTGAPPSAAIASPASPLASSRPAARGSVVAETFWAQALGTRKQYVVYLPPSYATQRDRRYPVAYYLHGAWGGEWDWVRQGHIDATLDSLIAAGLPELIVVMPDGDDGWYTTWNTLGNHAECTRNPPRGEPAATYCVPWPHYDDYIARDLVAKIDSSYRTLPERRHRGIAGLSMGGYGAMTLALRYPDVFSAAASHSGVLSPLYIGPHPFAEPARHATTIEELRRGWDRNWSLVASAFGRDTAAWWSRDPGRMAEQLVGRDRALLPALMFDVGVEDFLVDHSRDFRASLRRLGIDHEYAEWSGAHTWEYWRAHVPESLRWMAGRIASGGTRRGGDRR
jgi:S-formylglutathione hydrolase FrmB